VDINALLYSKYKKNTIIIYYNIRINKKKHAKIDYTKQAQYMIYGNNSNGQHPMDTIDYHT